MNNPAKSLWANNDETPASEDAVLNIIDSLFPSCSEHVPFGRGHDCAELAGMGAGITLSTDLFLEHSHFRKSYFTPKEVGAKALAAAVSDLAAAGAAPLGFSLGLVLPPGLPISALSALFGGMAEKAKAYKIALSGGDLSRGDSLGLSVTVWGQSVAGETPDKNKHSIIQNPPEQNAYPTAGENPGRGNGLPLFFRRNAPQAGDMIFLIGVCGLAGAGFRALEAMGRAAISRYPLATAAHLNPEPLLREGQALARFTRAFCEQHPSVAFDRISLMDVSDGLLRDLPRLLKGRGASIGAYRTLVDSASAEQQAAYAELALFAQAERLSVEELFFCGGEDYALLGTCPPEMWDGMIAAGLPVQLLGRVEKSGGILYDGKSFDVQFGSGFDHFSSQTQGSAPVDNDNDGSAKNSFCADQAQKECAAEQRGLSNCEHAASDPASSECRAGQQALPSFERAARDIVAYCKEGWATGLMAGFNGNVSHRITENNALSGKLPNKIDTSCASEGCCIITRSGAAKARLALSDFAVLALPSGDELFGPMASTEKAVHTAIYSACPQSQCIMHTHPPKLTALSLLVGPEDFLRLPLPEAENYRKKLAWAEFSPPGSAELATGVAKAAVLAPAVWMERHGLVVHGCSLAEVLSLTEELEQLASIQLAVL